MVLCTIYTSRCLRTEKVTLVEAAAGNQRYRLSVRLIQLNKVDVIHDLYPCHLTYFSDFLHFSSMTP